MQPSRRFSFPLIYRILTKALLKRDFGIEWDMPDSHLAPGITGRINYVCWIHEILHQHPDFQDCDTSKTVGIDIGTGASAIYPLLGHSLYHWSFIATDIDPVSIASSQSIIDQNHLNDSISLRQRSPSQPLLKDLVTEQQIAFCMCNPPFFASSDEMKQNPHVNTELTHNESITLGGEETFIRRILDESVELQRKVSLYSSLVGKKTTLKRILRVLRDKKVPSIGTVILSQKSVDDAQAPSNGGKRNTVRWCVFWSFDERFSSIFNAPGAKFKVFGKKKEAKKRFDVCFDVKEKEPVVWERVKEFCKACDGIAFKQENEESRVDIGHFEYHFPYGEGKGMNGPVTSSFAIEVESKEDGCLVSFRILQGDRATFFKVAEQLQHDILRTSRRWRRLGLRNGNSFVVCCQKQN